MTEREANLQLRALATAVSATQQAYTSKRITLQERETRLNRIRKNYGVFQTHPTLWQDQEGDVDPQKPEFENRRNGTNPLTKQEPQEGA